MGAPYRRVFTPSILSGTWCFLDVWVPSGASGISGSRLSDGTRSCWSDTFFSPAASQAGNASSKNGLIGSGSSVAKRRLRLSHRSLGRPGGPFAAF